MEIRIEGENVVATMTLPEAEIIGIRLKLDGHTKSQKGLGEQFLNAVRGGPKQE